MQTELRETKPVDSPPPILPQPGSAASADPNQVESILRNLLMAYAAGNLENANLVFLHLLQTIESLNLAMFDDAEKSQLGRLVATALAVFVQPDFEVLEPLSIPVLAKNVMIGNIVAGCLGTTTDPLIRQLFGQKQQVYKTMVLYSARNETPVEFGNLLVGSPELASVWLYQTWKVVCSGNCNEKVTRNLSRFLRRWNTGWSLRWICRNSTSVAPTWAFLKSDGPRS